MLLSRVPKSGLETAILVVFAVFASSACTTGNLGISADCRSPIPYKTQKISLDVAYGMLGIGGAYETNPPPSLDKQLHIYFHQAAVLCEEFHAERMSRDEYLAATQRIGTQFGNFMSLAKQSLKEAAGPGAKVEELQSFAAENGIKLTQEALPEPVHGELSIQGTGFASASGHWQDQLLACAVDGLVNIASARSTHVRSELIREKRTNKRTGKVTETSRDILTTRSTLSLKKAPKLRMESELTQRLHENSRGAIEARIEQTQNLSLPRKVLPVRRLKRRIHGTTSGSQHWTRSAWDSPPHLSRKHLSSFISFLARHDVFVTHLRYIGGNDPGFECLVSANPETLTPVMRK